MTLLPVLSFDGPFQSSHLINCNLSTLCASGVVDLLHLIHVRKLDAQRLFFFLQSKAMLFFYLFFFFFLTLFHDVMAAEGAILKHTEIKVNFIGNIKFA